MILHLTARLAWHDSCWNGRICSRPSDNIYCSGNYSLLSSRIQRRKNIDLESRYSGKDASEIIENENYIPPCYYVINLLGNKKLKVKHIHPFCDFIKKAKEGGIKPIEDLIEPHAILSWCFKYSFTRDEEQRKYLLPRYPRDLENRLNHYLSYIVSGKSIVIFYLNYSNPVNGDKHRYLIVGAALVKDVKKPKQYEFNLEYYKKLEKAFGGYFPPMEWSFQIVLDPETIVIIPYQEYIEKLEATKDEDTKRKIQDMINEVAVEVDKQSLIPHFKYVSMHISTDKTLYILYRILNALERIKEHGIVEQELIEKYIKRAEKLLEHLWRLRGEYPSLKKVLMALGEVRGIYAISSDYQRYREVEEKLEKFLELYYKKFKMIIENRDLNSLETLLNNIHQAGTVDSYCILLLREIFRLIKSRGETFFGLLKLLSRLDLTYSQIRSLIKSIEEKSIDIKTIVNNPYSLVYLYIPQSELQEKEWFIEFMDFNIDLYLLDISLIPDITYSTYLWQSTPKALDRLVATIYEVLNSKATFEGITAVREEDLIKTINEEQVLKLYHGSMPEILKADIDDIISNYKEVLSNIVHYVEDPNEGRIFQLKHIREIEHTIEDSIKKMLNKHKQEINKNVRVHIESIIESIHRQLSNIRIPNSQKEEILDTQSGIYHKATKHGLLMITGGAGTGKTETIVNLVKLYLCTNKKPIFIVTPTGKSALVIEERLRKRNLRDRFVEVSTIHRLLYSYYFEKFPYSHLRTEFIELVNTIDKVLNDTRFYTEFKNFITNNSRLKLKPKVLIIDEASMVDEVVLALLLSIIDLKNLEHLIIVGDKNQLPPIGLGKPFVDLVDYLSEKQEELVIALETPIRFSVKTGIWAFSQIFTFTDVPVDMPERYVDDTLKVIYYVDTQDLKEKIETITREVMKEVSGTNVTNSHDLLSLLNKTMGLETSREPRLDIIQILTPTRYGELGSEYVNNVLILNNRRICSYDYVKLINERNRYVNLRTLGKTLLVPNGSLGYWIRKDNAVCFREIDEIVSKLEAYGETIKNKKLIYSIRHDCDQLLKALKRLVNEIKGEYRETDIDISPGYAITIHKAQGSDFDYVIFVLPRLSSFITKELVYTALTRAKKRLYLLLNIDLKSRIVSILQEIRNISELDYRHTLLFRYRRSSGKKFSLKLRDGKIIHVRSKIEYMIAKTLDNLDVEFEYEPRDLEEYGVVPDFKVIANGKIFYIEHLGLLDKEVYKRRWEIKRRIYEKLGLLDQVVTTSEPKEGNINIEDTIRKIINDIRRGKLMETKSSFPSKYHYILASPS